MLNSLSIFEQEQISRIELLKLPRLPSVIRYLDDFADEWRSIRTADCPDEWEIQGAGRVFTLDFSAYPLQLRALLKHWAVWSLARLAPVTVEVYARFLHQVIDNEPSLPFMLLSAPPLELKEMWHKALLPRYIYHALASLKSLLFFCCEMSLGQLGPGHADFIGAFRLPQRDKYAAARTGEVFLHTDEEALIVDYLDEVNTQVRNSPTQLTDNELREACILCISYQYAMRPIQIAGVRLSDVQIYPLSKEDDGPAIHITFLRAKQRATSKRLPMVRKVKREWSFIFAEFHRNRVLRSDDLVERLALPDSLFGLTPDSVSKLLIKTTEAITSLPRPANHLRHSAAQRLVDAGASQAELAEFMGHSYVETSLVYFDASPAQADRVNKALALSPIYSNVAEVARTRTIDKDKLFHVASDYQIGGAPHGIPIAGIGICELGQSLCSKNPVLSCYSCRRFMAVADIDVHREVLQSLRPVVQFFYGESRGETASPAYMQLRSTLESIQAVVSNLEKEADYE